MFERTDCIYSERWVCIVTGLYSAMPFCSHPLRGRDFYTNFYGQWRRIGKSNRWRWFKRVSG